MDNVMHNPAVDEPVAGAEKIEKASGKTKPKAAKKASKPKAAKKAAGSKNGKTPKKGASIKVAKAKGGKAIKATAKHVVKQAATAADKSKLPSVTPEGYQSTGTLADQLIALEVGDVLCRAKRFEMKEIADRKFIEKTHLNMSGAITTAISSLRKRTRDFFHIIKVERGLYPTSDGGIMILMTATRLPGKYKG